MDLSGFGGLARSSPRYVSVRDVHSRARRFHVSCMYICMRVCVWIAARIDDEEREKKMPREKDVRKCVCKSLLLLRSSPRGYTGAYVSLYAVYRVPWSTYVCVCARARGRLYVCSRICSSTSAGVGRDDGRLGVRW